jgi:hypothetical protein
MINSEVFFFFFLFSLEKKKSGRFQIQSQLELHSKFKASLGYILGPYLKQKTSKQKTK